MNDEAFDVSNAKRYTDNLNQPLGEAEPNDQGCKQLNLYIMKIISKNSIRKVTLIEITPVTCHHHHL